MVHTIDTVTFIKLEHISLIANTNQVHSLHQIICPGHGRNYSPYNLMRYELIFVPF